MLEVILLNPPTKGAKRNASQADLEALAGWPGGRGARRADGNPARTRSRKRVLAKTPKLRRVSRPWSRRVAGKKLLAAPAARSATRSSPVAAHRKSVSERASRRLMSMAKTKRRSSRRRKSKRKGSSMSGYLKKAKRTRAWPYAQPGKHRDAMKLAAKRGGLGFKSWVRGLGHRGQKARRKGRSSLKPFAVLKRPVDGYRIAANKRRARRNIVTDNPRRKRGRRRGYRRVRRNMGILTNPFVASIKEVFTMDTLVTAGQVTLGSLAAVAVPNLLYSIPMVGKAVPDALKKGWGSYLVNLLSAGLVSGVASYFGKTAMARNLLIGGVSGTMTKIVMEQIVPKLPADIRKRTGLDGYGGMGILTADMESAVEEAVQQELTRQGMSDYLVPDEISAPQLGGLDDYLVPSEAATPGLGQEEYDGGEFF